MNDTNAKEDEMNATITSAKHLDGFTKIEYRCRAIAAYLKTGGTDQPCYTLTEVEGNRVVVRNVNGTLASYGITPAGKLVRLLDDAEDQDDAEAPTVLQFMAPPAR